jgi:tryptophan synthase alpha chain
MSSLLTNRFIKERLAGRKLFVPFITAGDRGLEFTRQALFALAKAGADAIELGVPFSDPLVDGRVIQLSYQRALEKGTTLDKILHLVKTIRPEIRVPIILMGSINPFLQPDLERNARLAAAAGVDGFIVPDLPPEEAVDWVRICREKDLDTIFLAAPTSTPERLKAVAHATTGYIYYVSVAGTTGVRRQLPEHLQQGVARVRQFSPLPVLIGFGISTPQQANQASRMADGIIVGSALVKTMETGTDTMALGRLVRLAKEMIKSVKKQ